LMRTHRSASLRASGKSALKLGFTNENRVSGVCHNSLIINRILALGRRGRGIRHSLPRMLDNDARDRSPCSSLPAL
jgi:hypothetical protein